MPAQSIWEEALAPELAHLERACAHSQSVLILNLPGGAADQVRALLAARIPLRSFSPPLTPPDTLSPWWWHITQEIEDDQIVKTLEFCRHHGISLVISSAQSRPIDADHILCLSSLPLKAARQLFLAASGTLKTPTSHAELDALLAHTACIPALIAQLASHAPLLSPRELTRRLPLDTRWELMDPDATLQTQVSDLHAALPDPQRTLLDIAALGHDHTLSLGLAEHIWPDQIAATRRALQGLMQAGWLVRHSGPTDRLQLLLPYARIIQTHEASRHAAALAFARGLATFRATAPITEEEGWKHEGPSAALACATLCEQGDSEAAAVCALVVHDWVKEAGNFPLGRLHLEAVAKGLEHIKDDVLRLDVLEALSFPNYYPTQERDGTLWAQRALEESVACDDLTRATRLGIGLTHMLYYEGSFGQARHTAHQTFKAASAVPSPALRRSGLEVASLMEFFLGDLTTARVWCDQALALWVRHPELHQSAQATCMFAWIRATVLGHVDASLQMLGGIEALAPSPYIRCLAQSATASLLVHSGQHDQEALALAKEAIKAGEQRGFKELVTSCRLVCAVVALDAGQAQKARTHCLTSAQHDDAHYNAMASLMVAACDMALGQMDLARARFDTLLDDESAVWPWEHLGPWCMLAALAYPESPKRAAALRLKARRWPVGVQIPGYSALLDLLEGKRPGDPESLKHLPMSVRPLKKLASLFHPLPHAPHRPTLCVGPKARWFELAGQEPCSLGRRGAIRRVFHALCLQQEAAPGEPLSVFELFEAGWPGQSHVAPELAAHRVYNTMSSLRNMGLEPWLVRDEVGYALDPEIAITWAN